MQSVALAFHKVAKFCKRDYQPNKKSTYIGDARVRSGGERLSSERDVDFDLGVCGRTNQIVYVSSHWDVEATGLNGSCKLSIADELNWRRKTSLSSGKSNEQR